MKNGSDLEELMGLLYGGQNNIYDCHHIAFNSRLLTKYLKQVGFRKISMWDWRAVDHGVYDDYSQCFLPHMDKTNGLLMSLNMEGIR
jgi:hypothetical protein